MLVARDSKTLSAYHVILTRMGNKPYRRQYSLAAETRETETREKQWSVPTPVVVMCSCLVTFSFVVRWSCQSLSPEMLFAVCEDSNTRLVLDLASA